VVGVLKVLDEHEVAVVKEGGQLPDREVPDAPGVLVLVGEAGVKYQAPERGSGLVDSAQWFDEERQRAVPWHDLNDALPGPCSELGAESKFGGLVALPTGVVTPPGGPEREAGLGHDEAALDHRTGDGIEGSESAVPLGGGTEDGHDVTSRLFLQADESWQETGRKGVTPGGLHQASRGRRQGPRAKRVGGGDSDEGRVTEEQGEGVITLRVGQAD